ncbi:TetR/AcrR family transcriptional regulator [Actinoplanes sp. L3-i22]|uniref:TetR/AcrR family transcriptional regulator n=1 Tax=Actinoplanes sp. L3-i22 TaxID=2836373 RepID=UPI001C84AE71|nr:TetR/AcrR family transcriptional regulator [Actinoplanes sp. L3-i22]
MTTVVSRRDRKKAATRQALADAALRLFTERGYDNVTVKEVAEAADVALSTLFKHFPAKEALVFEEDQDVEDALIRAVLERADDESVLHALCEHLVLTRTGRHISAPDLALVESTPALREYARRMWLRHEQALAAALAEATGRAPDDLAVTSLARLALDAPQLVRGSGDPAAAMRGLFHLISDGWAAAVTPGGQPGQHL